MRAGDTLQAIAQSAYGDRQLWFVIAQANGLTSDADLKVGMSLIIPSKVGSVHNTAETFKPYDPSELIGDTNPTLPVPQDEDDCGGFGMIIMLIVAAVVTAGVGSFLGVGATTTSLTGNIIGGAIAGAAGSVASQFVGLALGVIEEFDFKAVALAAIGGGVSGGVGKLILGTEVADKVLRAVVSNAVTQGIGVATGLQKSFDWRGVAAAGVGAGVGHVIGDALGYDPKKFDFGKSMAVSLGSGLASAVVRGGKINIGSIAADAFGNALGDAFVSCNVHLTQPIDLKHLSSGHPRFKLLQVCDSTPQAFSLLFSCCPMDRFIRQSHNAAAHLAYPCIKQNLEQKVLLAGKESARRAIEFIVMRM